MKGFWKWFLIVLGILVLIGIAFAAALFFFRGGARVGMMRPGVLAGRRAFGGMMFGLGGLMFFHMLIPLGILVLAGFGIAYFVKFGKKPAKAAPVVKTCANCGKTLSAEWTTCPYCGTKVEPSTEVTPKA